MNPVLCGDSGLMRDAAEDDRGESKCGQYLAELARRTHRDGKPKVNDNLTSKLGQRRSSGVPQRFTWEPIYSVHSKSPYGNTSHLSRPNSSSHTAAMIYETW